MYVYLVLMYDELRMAITIREVVETPAFRLKVLAGAGGLDREISWAHVCELPDPMEWLAEGELLMTVGFTVPGQASKQVNFIEKLTRAGVRGILICDQAYAPPLSEEMLSAAEELKFPVILAAYEVPFSAITRTVAEANRNEEHRRLLQVMKIYEAVRIATRRAEGVALLRSLEELLGCRLFVLDPETGLSLVRGAPEPPGDLVRALLEERARRSGPLPTGLRLQATIRPTLIMPVPASRRAVLAVVARDGFPDLFILHHITEIVALEVERLVAEYERNRRSGAEVLFGLIENRISMGSARYALMERGLAEGPHVVACCEESGEDPGYSKIHFRLEDHRVPHLMLVRSRRLIVLLRDTPDHLRVLLEEGRRLRMIIGLSRAVDDTGGIPNAYRQSLWALKAAARSGRPVAVYGKEEARISPFLPHEAEDIELIVRQILGRLLEYDGRHSSDLLHTLRTFLVQDRSWTKTAKMLHIHRQTLVYRIKRIEDLTQRSLGNTEDVAELWFALKAYEALNGEEGAGGFSRSR